jgi:hypothetical protein
LFAPLEATSVRGRGRPRKKGERLPTPAVMFQDRNLKWSEIKAFCYGKEIRLLVHQLTALWFHSAGTDAVSVVLCRDPKGKYADVVFFDTDVTASAKDIIERYAKRWSIEMTNRETKQLLGADDPQCRKENSVIRAPMFAYWAYSFVVLWFVREFSTAKSLVADPAPWYQAEEELHLFRHARRCPKEPFLLQNFFDGWGNQSVTKNQTNAPCARNRPYKDRETIGLKSGRENAKI